MKYYESFPGNGLADAPPQPFLALGPGATLIYLSCPPERGAPLRAIRMSTLFSNALSPFCRVCSSLFSTMAKGFAVISEFER